LCFNVRTERHRGDFVDCPTDVIGMTLLPGGAQLVAGGSDGKIRFWDFKRGLDEIKELEASLNELPWFCLTP
jgi:WD40 repeat protein